MAQHSRQSGVELNFDGLTDSVTNLVGALLLLIVLLVGITKAYVKANVAPPPPAPPVSPGSKSVFELQRQLESLRAAITAVDQEIDIIETQQLPPLRERAGQLLQQAGKTEPAPAAEDKRT